MAQEAPALTGCKIGFIGAGNMAEALIRGALDANAVDPSQVRVSDPQTDRQRFFREHLGIETTDNPSLVEWADIVLLAVKPQQLPDVLEEIRGAAGPQSLFISIAAGVKTETVESGLGEESRVVRVMPNTPSLVGKGAAALCGGRWSQSSDLEHTEALLNCVGITVRVDEQQMDAVTAVSGSGPAYIFLVMEAMAHSAEALGLSRETAEQLVDATVEGAAQLRAERGESAENLRQRVTSKGGTTEAALSVLQNHELTSAIREAMRAAHDRSVELGKG